MVGSGNWLDEVEVVVESAHEDRNDWLYPSEAERRAFLNAHLSRFGIGLDELDVDTEGKTPRFEEERIECGDHELVAIEASLPANDLKWRCRFCGAENTGTRWFRENECGGDGS